MINYIRNLFIFPIVKTRLSLNLRIQKKTILTSLNIDIIECKKTNDNSLNEDDFNKITDYYGLAVPVMIGESFCLLRGIEMSLKERLALTYLGGLTGLFDDFFDKKDLSVRHIKNLLEYPQKMIGENSAEKLILNFYCKALDNSSDSERLKNYSLKVYETQVSSKKQFHSDLGRKEINDITFQKGGNSVLFYRCSFNEEISEIEKELFYNLGSIWQIENDLLDVFKDYQAGIKTLVTVEHKIDNIRKLYYHLYDEIVTLLEQTQYPKSNKRLFLNSILLFICIGFVALDVLEKNEKKTNNIFQPGKYKRKDLICDIEKPINIIKIIHYFAKYNRAL